MGKFIAYLSVEGIEIGCGIRITTWEQRTSWHNMAGPRGRLDAWFYLEGDVCHGVMVGDTMAMRCHRLKDQDRAKRQHPTTVMCKGGMPSGMWERVRHAQARHIANF